MSHPLDLDLDRLPAGPNRVLVLPLLLPVVLGRMPSSVVFLVLRVFLPLLWLYKKGRVFIQNHVSDTTGGDRLSWIGFYGGFLLVSF